MGANELQELLTSTNTQARQLQEEDPNSAELAEFAKTIQAIETALRGIPGK